MKTLKNIGATLLTAWMIWVSATTVINQVKTELNEYRIDSISPVLQELTEKRE